MIIFWSTIEAEATLCEERTFCVIVEEMKEIVSFKRNFIFFDFDSHIGFVVAWLSVLSTILLNGFKASRLTFSINTSLPEHNI